MNFAWSTRQERMRFFLPHIISQKASPSTRFPTEIVKGRNPWPISLISNQTLRKAVVYNRRIQINLKVTTQPGDTKESRSTVPSVFVVPLHIPTFLFNFHSRASRIHTLFLQIYTISVQTRESSRWFEHITLPDYIHMSSSTQFRYCRCTISLLHSWKGNIRSYLILCRH